jgi:VanZ family protein
MNRKQIKLAAQLGGFLSIIIIAVLSLVPGSMRPHTGAPSQFEHVAAYVLAAGFLTVGYDNRRYPAVIALFLSIFSAVLEIAQTQIPGRNAAVLDFVASSIGAVIGCALTWVVLRLFRIAINQDQG